MSKSKKVFKTIIIIVSSFLILTVALAGIGLIGKREALDLEIIPINLDELDDGVYEGSYENFRWSNTVKVTIKDHQIADIVSVDIGNYATQTALINQVIDKIIEEQRNDIDTISGATASTNSLLKAVEDALK